MLHQLLIAAVLTLPSLAPDETVVRAEIGKSLESLSAAMLAANPSEYLALVDASDPEFYNEQKYFAKDFRKKPPAAVRFEVAEGDIRIDERSVELPVSLTWTMPEKKERSVTYRARFMMPPDASPRRWLYAGEAWVTSEAPGVLVMHDPGLEDLALKTVEAFTAVRAHVEDVFNLAQSEMSRRTQKIKIYGRMKHLQASICLSYENGLSGWNEPGEPIKLLANQRSTLRSLKNLLAHEYGHVATFELGPTSNHMPWWILEGVAEFAALKFSGGGPTRDRTVARWFSDDRIAPWDQISDFENTPDKWQRNVYTQGHSMVAFVDATFGKDSRIEWLTDMSNGATLDEGTMHALGISFKELDEKWMDEVRKFAESERKTAEEKKLREENQNAHSDK